MAVINKNENPANEPITTDEHRGQIIIIRILFLISILSSIVFLALSFINREVGYYLLAISSLITVLFGVMALPRGTRDVRPFFCVPPFSLLSTTDRSPSERTSFFSGNPVCDFSNSVGFDHLIRDPEERDQ